MENHNRRSALQSTLGRPRSVTDAQIEEILTWAAGRRTIKEKAKEMGLSAGVLAFVIRTGGKIYKTPSPEDRIKNLQQVHDRREHLKAHHWL